MDLSKNNPAEKAEAGYEFTVVLPDGTETDIKIKVRGTYSPAVKAFGKKAYNEFKTKEATARKRGKDVEEMTLDEAEEFAARSAAVRIISWSNLQDDGKDVPFSKESAEAILMKYPFIREQVMEESDNVYNFRHG